MQRSRVRRGPIPWNVAITWFLQWMLVRFATCCWIALIVVAFLFMDVELPLDVDKTRLDADAARALTRTVSSRLAERSSATCSSPCHGPSVGKPPGVE